MCASACNLIETCDSCEADLDDFFNQIQESSYELDDISERILNNEIIFATNDRITDEAFWNPIAEDLTILGRQDNTMSQEKIDLIRTVAAISAVSEVCKDSETHKQVHKQAETVLLLISRAKSHSAKKMSRDNPIAQLWVDLSSSVTRVLEFLRELVSEYWRRLSAWVNVEWLMDHMPSSLRDFVKMVSPADMKETIEKACSEGTCAAAEETLKALASLRVVRIASTFLATTLAFVNKQMRHANSDSDSGGSSYSTTFGISAAATAVASTWCSNSNARSNITKTKLALEHRYKRSTGSLQQG